MDRFLTPQPTPEEISLEKGLRPERLSDYIGQEGIKENLRVSIEAALARGEPLDHVLLYGPPGLGKTSLAWVISREMSVGIRTTSGPVLERTGDLAAILTSLRDGDILFIDEIHRLNPSVEEMLYPAMEEFKLDLIVGQGPGARTLRLDVPRFTLIGATTRLGLLTSPLRNRFGVVLRLDFYNVEELEAIVLRSARILGVKVDHQGATEIARRARGTPRIANRLLKRVRDYAQARADGAITLEVAKAALDLLEIDEAGFDALDRKFLLTIIQKFGGGPVGIDTLAASLGEERHTLEEVYEPYLIQEGYIQRTPRGRVATERAYRHFGLPLPPYIRQKGLPLEK
ncbi:MAG TPA: Holliday junction branch migration DNA helicase RuvB [Thermosulfidibacter takaii]|uniref:Holliday junction branch migration complex subunit RuvB n=1 Tax=Thermosulfidibacter takaii TaxID=412593 RepID=A0A7C0Y923_9BACT|nr:MAG: Holliday junction branch migration DNA helicase RuvB [Aquificota bacterium]HDD52997.1 Holliday junction branch migration DNA helicase RuvB [Thermosulfidibacter takaii]